MGVALPTRLEDDEATATVTALPDGSADHFYDVYAGGERIDRRAVFGESVTEGRTDAFTMRETAVEPGGHAVNAAVQADRLGETVTLVGHLDHQAFDGLSFETVSMGEPASVAVYEFDDGDVLAVEPSEAIDDWTLECLRTVVDEAFESLFSADAVVCANWPAFDALPEVLRAVADSDCDGSHFLFDPGGMDDPGAEATRELLSALGDLTDSYDVVLAANEVEVLSLAGALDEAEPDDRTAALERIRSAGGLAAAVCHETDAAVAATESDTLSVANADVEPVRNTGGGDRFDAGLGYALVREWPWPDALRLGNACATRYVATGESASPAELATFLREHW